MAAVACGGDSAVTTDSTDDAGTSGPKKDATTDTGAPGSDGGVGPGNQGDAASDEDASSSDDGAASTDAGSDASTTHDAGVCGTCAAGFTCSPSGICKSAAGVPQFGNVYLLLMENHSAKTITSSSDATYINSLIAGNVSATAYKDSLQHPSLPNYVALTSGDTHGISCDCQPGTQSSVCGAICTLNAGSCNCNQGTSVKSIADDIEARGKTWRSYADGATGACDTANHDHYAVKHVPFLYFDSIRTNAARCANTVPFTQLANEVGTYDFNFIAPSLCNDMHDSCAPTNNAIKQGDAWLQANVHTITDNPKFKKDGVLFITWDEGDEILGGLGGNDDTVELIIISPFAKAAGSTTPTAYDHYSLLATIQEGLGLPRLAKSVQATPIGDAWR